MIEVDRVSAGDLPAAATSFVGRRTETLLIRRLLTDSRLVTLTGSGGVGKSRLAVHVARQMRRVFANGVFFVNLAEINDGSSMAHVVADSIGVRPSSPESAVMDLSAYLADKHLLLVLDNCEHVVEACAELVTQLLAAPGIRILAVSRQSLSLVGEGIVEVPPLAVPSSDTPLSAREVSSYESVRLLLERTAVALPGFAVTDENCAEIATLCRCLDGIPLAIELAAVRLRSLSLSDLLGQLSDRFQLLALEQRGAPARHRTVRTMIEWSYQLCSPDERAVWSRLSVFAPGFSLKAAEAVCAGGGLHPSRVSTVIVGLNQKSVVVRMDSRGDTRFRLLETVRQYGLERLAESGQEASTRWLHWQWYRELASKADDDWFSPRQAEWLSRLRLEHPNLRQALEFEGGLRDVGRQRHLAASLMNYWLSTGLNAEGRHWLNHLLSSGHSVGETRRHALVADLQLTLVDGDQAAGKALLADYRTTLAGQSDPVAQAHLQHFTGMAHLFRGEMPEAMRELETALSAYRSSGRDYHAWLVLFKLALASSVAGRPSSEKLCLEIVQLSEQAGATWCLYYSLWLFAQDHWIRGDFAGAKTLLISSLEARRALDDPWGLACCAELAAWILESTGRAAESAVVLGAARGLWLAVGVSVENLGFMKVPHERCLSRLRATLGPDRLGVLLDEGLRGEPSEVVDRALGATAEVRTPKSENRPDLALTQREREVAALIAGGLTNKAIAARLSIATRTAEAHVQHILVRLGMTSRAQVGAWWAGEASREAVRGPG